MIAPAKPTCPCCGAMLQERDHGSNAAFDWTFDIFTCGTQRQACAETDRTVVETRSPACKAATGTIDAPLSRRPLGAISRRAGIAAINKLIG